MIGRLDKRHRHRLPAINPVVCFGKYPFDPHLPGANHALHPVRCVVPKMAHEKAVDPHAVQVAFDGELSGEGVAFGNQASIRRSEIAFSASWLWTVRR